MPFRNGKGIGKIGTCRGIIPAACSVASMVRVASLRTSSATTAPAPDFACVRRFDRCIKCQKVGLAVDALDRPGNLRQLGNLGLQHLLMIHFGQSHNFLLVLQMDVHQRTDHANRSTMRIAPGLASCPEPTVFANVDSAQGTKYLEALEYYLAIAVPKASQ